MIYRLTEQAQAELEAAVAYYDEQSPGLGHEFAEEVHKTCAAFTAMPRAFPMLSRRARTAITDRFRHMVLFQIREDHVLVIAITHFRQHPDTWQKRL